MEFDIKRKVFLEAVQKTLGIVERKTTMPILSNLLIRAGQGRITIVATDREIGLVADYEAQTTVPGDITVSAKKLHEMIRETQGETIHVVKNERNIVILTSGKVTYRIPGLSTEEYPAVVDDDEMPLYNIKASLIKEMIRKTSFAISTDDMRKNLSGVFLETEPSDESIGVRMVATDGHRLASMKGDAGDHTFLRLGKGVIVPRKGLGEIRRLLEDTPEEVKIGVRQGILVIKSDQVLLKVSLIDGEYPDYKRVIPSEKGVVVEMDKNQFLHSLRRMSVISSERYNGVIVTLSENKVVLNSTNPDVGEANDEIEAVYQGEERSVGYNVTYLAEAIEVIDEDRIELEIGAEMKPAIVRAVGNHCYFCIVMPLKL